MGKRAIDGAATLSGFGISAEIARPTTAPQASPHSYEDSWYRTLRVMAGDELDEAAGVEEPAPVVEPERTLTVVAPIEPAEDSAPHVAPQASPHSYEDNWYQILKTRRSAQDEG